jgi:predicted ABC-type ATPase
MGESFAFETTLAGRSYAPWLRRCVAAGYELYLVFLWLPSADLAVARVARCVAAGGHNIPEAVIRRRYGTGIRNFFHLHRTLASEWRVYDARQRAVRLIASGVGAAETIVDYGAWSRIVRMGGTHAADG